MDIRDAKVYSLYGEPRLALLVDEKPPTRDDLEYEHDGDYWYAIKNEYVDYFIDSGSGGVSRTVTTLDGDERSFANVGAGRASILNKHDIGPFVDVKITTDEDEFDAGPGQMQEATVTFDAAKRAAEIAGVELTRDESFDGEVTWLPTTHD